MTLQWDRIAADALRTRITDPLPAWTPHRLRLVIFLNGLTRADTAQLLGVSRRGFDKWMVKPTSQDHRRMPDPIWELLLIKIGWRVVGSPNDVLARISKSQAASSRSAAVTSFWKSIKCLLPSL